MPEEHSFRVGVLGATGVVGQRFIQLLEGHPWFTVAVLGASPRSAGRPYAEAVTWMMDTPIPEHVAALTVQPCDVTQFAAQCDFVFSALSAGVAAEVEHVFAGADIPVFSNARAHRYDVDVPILIPFCNPDHIDSIPFQRQRRGYKRGFIVTNANCSTTGLAIALHPLHVAFGVEQVMVVTMQAISGAGYPGLPSMAIQDNVIPLIDGEEPKLELEPRKILGSFGAAAGFTAEHEAPITLSSTCTRVHVLDGHTEVVHVRFRQRGVSPDDVRMVLEAGNQAACDLALPSAPTRPIVHHTAADRPQPRLDRNTGGGYSVGVGRVRECALLDAKFVVLSHNTVIGAAGGSILNAELAVRKGYLTAA